MDHSYFKDKISAYFDGALEAQERELIRRHLTDCEECRGILEEFKRLSEAIERNSDLGSDEYFEKLAQKIEKRIGEPEEKVVDVRAFRWKPVIWKLSAAAASIVLIGTIGYYQWFRDDELPERMLERNKTPATLEQPPSDSVEDTDLEGAIEEVSGRRDSKIGSGEVVKKEETPKAAFSDETDKRDLGNVLPEAQSVRIDTVEVKNGPKPVSQSPAEESENVIGKVKEVRAAADEFGARQEGLSSKLAEKSTDSLKETERTEELDLGALQVQNRILVSQIVRDNKLDNLKEFYSANKRAALSSKLTADAKAPDSIYQQLALNWYQIGQITKDSIERNEAIQYLNWYKINFPKDSTQTIQYLKEIKE